MARSKRIRVIVFIFFTFIFLLSGCQSSVQQVEKKISNEYSLHSENDDVIIQGEKEVKTSPQKKEKKHVTKNNTQNKTIDIVAPKNEIYQSKTVKHPEQATTAEQESADMVAKLIVYFINAKQFSELSLKQEIAVMEDKYKRDENPVTHIKLAYLLSLSKWSINSARKISNLLNSVRKNSGVHANYKALSDFLSSYINTQNDLQFRLGVERKQNKELQKQLDALTDIEMKINEREPIPNTSIEEPNP